jgi:proteic killer suppression protein
MVMFCINNALHDHRNGLLWSHPLIKSFGNKDTQMFWETGKARMPPANLRSVAKRKLLMIDAATRLDDLKSPPGNHLHALYGDRAGQHAIWINEQYRVCFVWKEGNAYEVEVVDYHR